MKREDIFYIFENIDGIIYIVDLTNYRILYANKVLIEALNKQLIGKICYKEIYNKDQPCEFCKANILLENDRKSCQWEFYNPIFDKYFLVIDQLITLPDKHKLKILLGIDITERKKTETKLRENEQKYRTLFEFAPDFAYILDKNGFIRDINSNALKRLGYTKEEIIGSHLTRIFHPESHEIFAKEFPILLSRGYNRAEVKLITKNGEIIEVDCIASAIKNDKGEIEYFVVIERDIGNYKKLERQLRESEARYYALFNLSIDAIFLETLDGQIIDCNETACKLLGYKKEELIGLNAADVVPEEVASSFPDLINKLLISGSFSVETFGKRKDGTIFPTEVRAKLINVEDQKFVLVYLRDITARKEAEREKYELQEQLRQAQKLEALGTLAGGIAHDFNNLLTVIQGHAELALIKAQNYPELKKNIELIKEAAEKATQLTSQLLAFSRKQIYEPKIVNVNEIIKNLDKMLRRLISEDIQIEINLSSDLPYIIADPTQIEQILINLVVNARDAINELGDKAKEKKILIETDYVFLDEEYVARHVGAQVGPHVLISISDTGIGMDEETQKKIFDPFFTTKGPSKGTGLGLATVYGIVKQNQGSIYVYSELGRGTTFKIYWPAVEEKSSHIDTKDFVEILKGTEKILLVEDEELVRNFMSNALSALGYKVYEASDGEEALRLIKEKGLAPDLLITDLIMPKMSGKELAEKIKEMLPNLCVLYMSGYTEEYITINGLLEKGVGFLQKPFTIQKLTQKIREILSTR